MSTPSHDHHRRFHRVHDHLTAAYGDGWFGAKAEAFARYFGTPLFLAAQTLIVLIWVAVNVAGLTAFDPYPFILLNLAFSLQAAYAAPMILLAQTRQADRDKAHADADAQHREDLARAAARRQDEAAVESAHMLDLVRQNTTLTEAVKTLSERIQDLTVEMHGRTCPDAAKR